MSKGTQGTKGPDYVVEEDDFFGSHIQKKIRKFKKKLKEIEELEVKKEEELNPSQREKLSSREEQEEGIRAAEELLRSYVTAYVDALGESSEAPKIHIVPGKKEQKKLEKKAAATKAVEKPAEKPVEKPAEKPVEKPAAVAKAPEASHKELDAGKLRSILNLVHCAQFFSNHGAIEDFQRSEGSHDHLNEVYGHIAEFYHKVFTYTEAAKFSTNEDKINSGAHELEQYLSRSKSAALKNKSYSELFDIVEKVTGTKHFHEKTADFDKHTGHKAETKSHQAAIGSEVRHKDAAAHKEAPVAPKETAHTETHAPKAQQASPTITQQASATKEHKEHKEHKEVEAPKEEEKPQGTKKAWHQIDSDEDEEEGEEAGEQAPPKENKPEKSSPLKQERPQQQKRQWEEKPKPTGEPEVDEDGFIIVRSAKEKKEAQLAAERAARGPRRGGGGRGGPRGGQGGRGGPRRGGPRPPREGYEGEEGEGHEGGYRGGRGQWRPKTEGGEEGGRPWRGGRGGGDRPWRGRGGDGARAGDNEEKQVFQEKAAPAPTGGN